MFKKIKNIWNLGDYKVAKLDDPVNGIRDGQLILDEAVGDGKAEFLGEGTEEEYKRMVEEDKGFKKRIFGL